MENMHGIGRELARELLKAWRSAGSGPVYIDGARIHHYHLGLFFMSMGDLANKMDKKELGRELWDFGRELFIDDVGDLICDLISCFES